MIMCHSANSHFALLLQPGLTSQCISSIMQHCWDPFHSVPQHITCTQRSLSTILRQALQPAWFHSETTDMAPSGTPARLPGCSAPLCCRAWSLDYHRSRVHLELSFLGHLKWRSVSHRELSVTLRAWPGKEWRRGGGKELKRGGGGGKALLGSTAVQGTTG